VTGVKVRKGWEARKPGGREGREAGRFEAASLKVKG
jgi:hypothetical protein